MFNGSSLIVYINAGITFNLYHHHQTTITNYLTLLWNKEVLGFLQGRAVEGRISKYASSCLTLGICSNSVLFFSEILYRSLRYLRQHQEVKLFLGFMAQTILKWLQSSKHWLCSMKIIMQYGNKKYGYI